MNQYTFKQALNAIPMIRPFVGSAQLECLGDLCRGEERQFFINKICDLGNQISTMPQTYETDGQGLDAVVQLHYFTPGADWYITEKDMNAEQQQAFGLADLFGDGGELGYISIEEILSCGAELDLHWTPKTLNQIRKGA